MTPAQIIVVDNGSKEPNALLALAEIPNLHLIYNTINEGFAAACNKAIQLAARSGTDAFWLLNNDARAAPGALHALTSWAQKARRAGIVGSIIRADGPNSPILHGGAYVDLLRGRCSHLPNDSDMERVTSLRTRSPFVTGCSVLLTRELIDDIGLLDEQYFLYWEDVDICSRALRNGWRVVVAAEAVVYHGHSQSLGDGSSLKGYYSARNSLLYFYKNHPAYLPFAILWWPRRHLLNHLFRGRLRHLQLALEALRDLALGRVRRPAVR